MINIYKHESVLIYSMTESCIVVIIVIVLALAIQVGRRIFNTRSGDAKVYS